MSQQTNIVLELDLEEQEQLIEAIWIATQQPNISPSKIEQLQMLHNLIVQKRVELDPDFEQAP